MASTPIPNIRAYSPGRDITGVATAAVTARTFVKVSGDRSGGNIAVAPATAAGRIFGVAATDAAQGGLVAVARDGVVKVTTAAAITAFAEVEVGSGGKAKALDEGTAVGYAITGAASGADAEIALY